MQAVLLRINVRPVQPPRGVSNCRVHGLLYSRAFWVNDSIIAWNVDVGNGSCYLFASKTAALSCSSDENETKVSRSILLSHRSRILLAAVENFSNLLRITIRYSSPLFRLRTANVIQERVRLYNTGPSFLPGVIVVSIEEGHEGVPGLSQAGCNVTSTDEIVKRSAYDASSGCFTAPPRTTSVFVKPREV